jgi:hypothetical protein
MRIRWKPFLVTMAVALPAAGQEPRGIYLTSPLSLSAGREQKMLTGSGPIDDTVFLLEAPTLSLLRRNPRTAVTLGYRPEFELFASHRNLDAWNHAAGLRLTHAWTRRLSFQLGESFQATHDPSRWQGGGFFLLPRSNYKENSAYAGMDYALSRQTSLALRVDHAYTTARLDEAPRLKLLENRSYAGSASLSRRFARRHRITGSYSFVKFSLSAPERLQAPADTTSQPPADTTSQLPAAATPVNHAHTASLSYGIELARDFTLELTGGALRSSGTTWSASARLEKKFRPVRIRADYGRQVSILSGFSSPGAGDVAGLGFARGLTPSAVVQSGSLQITARFGRRLGADLRGSYARNESSQLVERATHTFVGRARVDCRLTERMYLFASGDAYRQNTSFPVAEPLKRNRIFGGIEFVLSRPRSPDIAAGLLSESGLQNTLLAEASRTTRSDSLPASDADGREKKDKDKEKGKERERE